MISIIVPLYNRLGLIGQTIQSVLDQSYADWQLVIVDDLSDDGSYERAMEYSSSDDRIVVLKRNRDSKGASTCRNIGMEHAEGEYLMFLDSDDLLIPNCLENRLRTIEVLPTADFIVSQVGIINSEEELTSLWSTLKHNDDIKAFVRFLGWSVASTLFRTSMVKRYSWDESAISWQDWEFHLNILLDSPNYKKYPDSKPDVLIKRGHNDRITVNRVTFERIESRMNLLILFEYKFKNTNNEYLIYFFLQHYFRLLEQASTLLTNSEFKHLYASWKKSDTYKKRGLVLLKLYWRIHRFGVTLKLRLINSINYRVSRLWLPSSITDVKRREVVYTKPHG